MHLYNADNRFETPWSCNFEKVRLPCQHSTNDPQSLLILSWTKAVSRVPAHQKWLSKMADPTTLEKFKQDFLGKESRLFNEYIASVFDAQKTQDECRMIFKKYGYGGLTDRDFLALWNTTPEALFKSALKENTTPADQPDDTSKPAVAPSALKWDDIRVFGGIYRVSGPSDDDGTRLAVNPCNGEVKYRGSSIQPRVEWDSASSTPKATWQDDSGRTIVIEPSVHFDPSTQTIYQQFQGTVSDPESTSPASFTGRSIAPLVPSQRDDLNKKVDQDPANEAPVVHKSRVLSRQRILSDDPNPLLTNANLIVTLAFSGFAVIKASCMLFRWWRTRSDRSLLTEFHGVQVDSARDNTAKAADEGLKQAMEKQPNLRENLQKDFEAPMREKIRDKLIELEAIPGNPHLAKLKANDFDPRKEPWLGLVKEINGVVSQKMETVTKQYCRDAMLSKLAECRQRDPTITEVEGARAFKDAIAIHSEEGVQNLGCGLKQDSKKWSDTLAGNLIFSMAQARQKAFLETEQQKSSDAWAVRARQLVKNRDDAQTEKTKFEEALKEENAKPNPDLVAAKKIETELRVKEKAFKDAVDQARTESDAREKKEADEKVDIGEADSEGKRTEAAGKSILQTHFAR